MRVPPPVVVLTMCAGLQRSVEVWENGKFGKACAMRVTLAEAK
jgi:hypothetical protein